MGMANQQLLNLDPITDIHLRKHLEFIRSIQQPEHVHYYYTEFCHSRKRDEIPVSVIAAMKLIVKDMDEYLDMILKQSGYHNINVDGCMV